jgi:predicted phage tail protein
MTPWILIAALLLAPPPTAPPPDRALAEGAITSARHAVEQAAHDTHRTDAEKKLSDAEALFAKGAYADAATAADSAWKLLDASGEKTRFEVQVAPDGTTEVKTRTGQPVRVESEGKTVAVAPGEHALVHKGEPPEHTAGPPPVEKVALTAPSLLAPRDHGKLSFKPAQKLGPVLLSWSKVHGASGYEVIVTDGDHHEAFTAKVSSAKAKLPPLPPGQYAWTVRALGATGEQSDPSQRSFELVPERIKLEVQTSKWK